MADTETRSTGQAYDLAAVQRAATAPECQLVPIPGEDGYATYDDMFRTYTVSPAGKHHKQQPPRFYAGFGCDELPPELLLQLGEDTHPVEHMNVTHQWFQQIVLRDPHLFTPYATSLGRLAGQFHDVGENTDENLAALAEVTLPPGDIARGKKTDHDRQNEEKIRRAVYRHIIDPQWPADVIENVEDVVSHRAQPERAGIYTEDDHPLAVVDDALEVAHAIGGATVVSRAVIRLLQQRRAGRTPNAALYTLAEEVGASARAKLHAYSSTFHFAGTIATRVGWTQRAMRDLRTRTIIAA